MAREGSFDGEVMCLRGDARVSRTGEVMWVDESGRLSFMGVDKGVTCLSGDARVSRTGEVVRRDGDVEGWVGEVGVLPFVGVDSVDFVGVDDVDFVGVTGEEERMSREKMLRVGVCGVADATVCAWVGVDGVLMACDEKGDLDGEVKRKGKAEEGEGGG
jgi:hypothetical protein